MTFLFDDGPPLAAPPLRLRVTAPAAVLGAIDERIYCPRRLCRHEHFSDITLVSEHEQTRMHTTLTEHNAEHTTEHSEHVRVLPP